MTQLLICEGKNMERSSLETRCPDSHVVRVLLRTPSDSFEFQMCLEQAENLMPGMNSRFGYGLVYNMCTHAPSHIHISLCTFT